MPNTDPAPNRPDPPDAAAGPVPTPGDPTDQPVTALRGATVDVDIRRTAKVAVGLGLATLVVLAVALLVAGLHTNSQIDRLHHDAVPVSVTVTHCTGLIGGSGSQGAGYSCVGAYTVAGTRYHQTIPGTEILYTVGSTIPGLVVPSDPKLLSTPGLVAQQHASWRVFVLPVALLVVALAWGALLMARRRRRAGGPDRSGPHPDESR